MPTLQNVIFSITPKWVNYHNFTDGEMEAYRIEVIFSSSLSWKVVNLGFKPRSDWFPAIVHYVTSTQHNYVNVLPVKNFVLLRYKHN